METYSPESANIQVDSVENRAKNQNFFSLKSVTWKTLPREGKNRIADRPLCISEVFRLLFLPKSSTLLKQNPHLAQHKGSKFYTYIHTKLCALIRPLASLPLLPKNRATQHEFKA
jgi:hypothetical protein